MTYYSYTSAVRQRHGECLLPDRLVAWSVVPCRSGWKSITSLTLPDETIRRLITLLCQMSVALEVADARLLVDGELDVYGVAMDDMYLSWEDDNRGGIRDGASSGGLWPREIVITTRRGYRFAVLSLTWPRQQTKEDIT